MPRVTIGFAAAFIVLGLGAYAATGAEHWTALLPAIFGLVLLAFGLLALRDNLRKLMMHLAVLWAVLMFFGTAGAIGGVVRMLAGEQIERPTAVTVQALTALLAAVFVGLCIKSFIDARRQASAAGNP